jgi:hypothetical protein
MLKNIFRIFSCLMVCFAINSPIATADEPQKNLIKLADQITAQMEKLRGLTRHGPAIQKDFLKAVTSKATTEAYLKQRLSEEYSDAELEQEGELMIRFGIIPPGTNYKQAMLDFILQEIAGFYDPAKRTLFLADWVSTTMQTSILSHEITHALQDAHFDLKRFMKRSLHNDDQTLAREALFEGDATLAMSLYGLTGGGASASEAHLLFQSGISATLETMNLSQYVVQKEQAGTKTNLRAIQQMAYFPYFSGLKFVMHLFEASPEQQPWKLVDQAYDKLPQSSSEILHPDLYLNGITSNAKEKGAAKISFDVATKILGSGKTTWQPQQDDNVFGEFGCQLLLSGVVSEEEAARSCEGWRADRYATFVNAPTAKDSTNPKKSWVMLWVSLWGSAVQATNFTNTMEKYLQNNEIFKRIITCKI